MDTDKYEQANIEVVKEIGIFYLKSIILANGASVVAILTFIGSLLSTNVDSINKDGFNGLQRSMYYFASGIVLALSSTGATYFGAQASLSKKAIIANIFLIVSVLLAAGGLVVFIAGSYAAINSFASLAV